MNRLKKHVFKRDYTLKSLSESDVGHLSEKKSKKLRFQLAIKIINNRIEYALFLYKDYMNCRLFSFKIMTFQRIDLISILEMALSL